MAFALSARREVVEMEGLYKGCFNSKKSLFRKMELAVDIREGEHKPNTPISLMEQIKLLQKQQTSYHHQQSKISH